MKPKSGNRFRICGTPSKTGCITCKIRRVKCGEEHPFCKRCTSTGRKCDGYAPPKSPDRSARNSTPRSISRGSSQSPDSDSLEQQLLYFFRTVTAPNLSGQFSSDFWERRVFQASTIEPSVRHAVIAIAGIHQDYLSWTQNRVANPSIQAFAFRQYAKAITYLHHLMSIQTQSFDITLIACICFISFDCLLGNHESAIIHLKAGLKILEDIRLRRSPGSNKIHEWEREFGPILLSLGTQAASFINPNHDVDRSELWVSLRDVGTTNPTNDFRSLEEARHALDAIAANITVERNERGKIFKNVHYYDSNNPGLPDSVQQMNKLISWTEGIDRFLIDFITNDPNFAKRINFGASLLKLHCLIYQIVVEAPMNSAEKFQDVLAHCDFLTSAHSSPTYRPEHSPFMPHMGLIAPLFFTILKAPDFSCRQTAAELLSRVHGREGMWDAQDALRIAKDALDAAGYGSWAAENPHLTGFPAPTSQRMRHSITDRMVWPFGERWEIPISSQHTTPQLDFTVPYSATSSQTTPQPAQEAMFPREQVPPQVKVEPIYMLSTDTGPQMMTDTSFSNLLQPDYNWMPYE